MTKGVPQDDKRGDSERQRGSCCRRRRLSSACRNDRQPAQRGPKSTGLL
jgi:hypothetical protein